MDKRWNTHEVINQCAAMGENMLLAIVGNTDLLRRQRNFLLNLAKEYEGLYGEQEINGLIELCDRLLDSLKTTEWGE